MRIVEKDAQAADPPYDSRSVSNSGGNGESAEGWGTDDEPLCRPLGGFLDAVGVWVLLHFRCAGRRPKRAPSRQLLPSLFPLLPLTVTAIWNECLVHCSAS